MASSKGGGAARIGEMEKMSVEQLKALKEQTDLEVNLLQDSLNNIRTATTRLEIASTALHDLSLRPQGKKMLVPLTASLYVPGTLDEADKVLVDIGTGYFVEKTMSEGKDYCERKINLLKSNFDQLIEDWLNRALTTSLLPLQLYKHEPFKSKCCHLRGVSFFSIVVSTYP
ncbi:probable prefoldin subunit 5 isoform X2 [Ricinus communis]|nr:probable prefoldin subunit 5 isoform X2 [Ricinus communis]|eukprot:XP_015575806.1 probable prefoldin subunit 5 isoform X2 [Ricinus communis]